MTDIIQGDKFEKIADLTFAPAIRSSGDYSKLPNTFFIEQCFRFNPCFVYTHTLYVKQLFDIIKDINHKFVIVTHNCDTNIDFSPPNNVIKWFSQNVNIIHEKIESVPIGLENDRWLKNVHKINKMLDKLQQPRIYKKLVYMNHNISTYPKERLMVYNLFKGKSWVTVQDGMNGQDFDGYLDNIYNHKFVICPRGNGLDTHRTWECLYVGSIPIEKRNLNNRFYTDLPICFIDEWEDLTEDFLNDQYATISSVIKGWNLEKLNFEYWKDKIRNYE